MSDPYLILHKVHGQPAFDIATKIQIGEEEGWVIPTSGHRAYPYMHWPLDHYFGQPVTDLPPNWPDHYPKPVPEPFKPSLIQQLGLVRQPPRRV